MNENYVMLATLEVIGEKYRLNFKHSDEALVNLQKNSNMLKVDLGKQLSNEQRKVRNDIFKRITKILSGVRGIVQEIDDDDLEIYCSEEI